MTAAAWLGLQEAMPDATLVRADRSSTSSA